VREAIVVALLVALMAATGCRLTNGWAEALANMAEGEISTTAVLDGVWTGDLTPVGETTSYPAHGAVWDGRLLAVSPGASTAFAGAVAPASSGTSGDLAADEIRAYDADGAAQGTGTLSGTFAEADTLAVIAAGSSRDGTLSQTYDSLFERNTGLNSFVASWSETRDGRTVTLTVDASFNVTGSSSDGCSYSGELSLLDEARNLYRQHLTIESCADENGDYSGLAYLDPDSSPPEWLALTERADEARFWWARLEKQ